MPERSDALGDRSDRPPATGNPATDFSIALLTAFVRRGVRHVVLSPGSRSQALALVAAELERSGSIELHVRIDERVAGFLALGLAVESGMPALVVTTSGTATANLHPAVLEAHHSGVPMIVLTADRPLELRGIRSNQTTVQPGLYGAAVRLSQDVAAPTGAAGEAESADVLVESALVAALGRVSSDPGPVHLNLAFREPLSVAVPKLAAPEAELAQSVSSSRPEIVGEGPRTVVVAGHGAGPEAEEFARAGGWPLLAEVSSGARFGPQLVVSYRELLADPDFGGRVERAIVFGHPTLSREIPALLIRDDVEVIVVAPTGTEFYNPGRRARMVRAVVAAEGIDTSSREAREWAGRWVFASRRILEAAAADSPDQRAPELDVSGSVKPSDRVAFARAELAVARTPITRRMLVEALWRFTWPHDRLVLGASRLIREADRAVTGKKIRVHANRGLAGIDGTVSTAIGMALAAPRDKPGVTRVLLGDLALLHDVGALLFGVSERRPAIQVIVGNDEGGTIFDGLEVAATASAQAMDRVLLTPQKADFAALAQAYGWSYRRATTRGELDEGLSVATSGPSILEVPLPRE